MLAIALGARPDVLLLDEPLASLDPLARTEFLAVLKDAVRSRGMTAMLSSHIIADIEQACDSLMVLGVGRVLYHNSIAAALAEHAIFSGQEAAPPDTHTVGQFPSSSEGLVTLVRGAPPALSGPSSAATLDDIVKGYLTSGRTKHQVTAGVPT
jgi:ABC-2 type transport system ATP-binding protein